MKLLFIAIYLFKTLMPSLNYISALENNLTLSGGEVDISKYLPQSGRLLEIDGKEYILSELDGTGNKDIIAAYKDDKAKNAVFLLVLGDGKDGDYQYRLKGDGNALDFIKTSDINGDNIDDIILGTKIGQDTCQLSVFSYRNSLLRKEFSYPYNKFELLEDGRNNKSKNKPMAFWTRTPDGYYKVELVRWNGSELVDANELQRNYFKKVVEYFNELDSSNYDNPYYWYYKAEAHIKAAQKKEALSSIAKGIALDKENPTKQEFEKLKSKLR